MTELAGVLTGGVGEAKRLLTDRIAHLNTRKVQF